MRSISQSFEIERMAGKGWDKMGVGQIGSVMWSDRVQNGRWRIKVDVNFAKHGTLQKLEWIC